MQVLSFSLVNQYKFKGIWRVALIVALLLALAGPAAAPLRSGFVKAQPELLQLIAAQPEATLSVIVQKLEAGGDLSGEITRLGGRITTDLSIINGFAADLPAHAIVELAQNPAVRWVSYDAPVKRTDCSDCTTTGKLVNMYNQAINANQVWGRGLKGQGIGVAVVDSGVDFTQDLYTIWGANRVVASAAFHGGYNATAFDGYSHGSHVAGIVGGNGRSSDGKYIGVAPEVNIINIKVSDDLQNGMGTARTLVNGLQWILQNKNTYNIRVVNISVNSSVRESYHTSPINAAVEVLWFNGIVVVVSAGNSGESALYPPANDPFVITVGATDDRGTASIGDDVVTSFSAYGKTSDGFNKPDLVAPGRNIVSLMGNQGMGLPAQYPNNVVWSGSTAYFRMSGTSMSSPMVAGAVALLLQDEPRLTPDQVKYRLMATANQTWGGYSSAKAGAGYLDVKAAIDGTTTQNANTGIQASKLLWTGAQPVTWSSVSWNSVSWNSVSWNSVSWNSVSWNSVSWNSDYWGP